MEEPFGQAGCTLRSGIRQGAERLLREIRVRPEGYFFESTESAGRPVPLSYRRFRALCRLTRGRTPAREWPAERALTPLLIG